LCFTHSVALNIHVAFSALDLHTPSEVFDTKKGSPISGHVGLVTYGLAFEYST